NALEKFESGFSTCEVTNSHKFQDLGQGCPWCELEDDWRIALFGAQRKIERMSPEMDIERVWKEIEGVPLPQTYEVPEPLKLEQVEATKIRRAWLFNMTAWIIFGSI